MTITVPPLDSDTPSKVASSAEATSTGSGAPKAVPCSGSLPAQAEHCLAHARRYVNSTIQDIIEPSIKTFLETCETNPRVAIVSATPAILAFLLAVAFSVFSTLVVILWSLLTITTNVGFIIVDGLLKMLFKLLIVFIAAIPMAAIAAALLVGANATSQFIIKKTSQFPLGAATTDAGGPRTMGETDWKEVLLMFGNLAAQCARGAIPILLVVREALTDVGLALHSFLQTVLLALHKGEAGTTGNSPARRKDSPSSADGKKGDGEYSPVLIHRELDAGTAERVSSRGESSAKGLKRRAPFPNVADDGEEPN